MDYEEACKKINKKLRLHGIDPHGVHIQDIGLSGRFVATLKGHRIGFDPDLMVHTILEAPGADQFDSLLHAIQDMYEKDKEG